MSQPSQILHFDTLIVGAGPVGLFAVFELGLLEMKAAVIDVLPQVGGQCSQLYPEKPIYDIPALPSVTGNQLTESLMEQIAPFHPQFFLNDLATSYKREEDGHFLLTLESGQQLRAKTIVIAAGQGCFAPRKPPRLANLETYESTSVLYSIRTPEALYGKRLLIVGGGDSALDWANALTEHADVTLLHRRKAFSGAPKSASQFLERCEKHEARFLIGEMKELHGDGTHLNAVTIQPSDKSQDPFLWEGDYVIPFFGLLPNPGPLKNWELNLENDLIPVNTENFETCIPGIFCIGDFCTYPGKLKLILSGFHEGALMAQKAYTYCIENKKPAMVYTTANRKLKTKIDSIHEDLT